MSPRSITGPCAEHIDQFPLDPGQRGPPVARRSGDDPLPLDADAGQVAAKLEQDAFRRRLLPQAAVAGQGLAKLPRRRRAGHRQDLVDRLRQAVLADPLNAEPARLLVEPGKALDEAERCATSSPLTPPANCPPPTAGFARSSPGRGNRRPSSPRRRSSASPRLGPRTASRGLPLRSGSIFTTWKSAARSNSFAAVARLSKGMPTRVQPRSATRPRARRRRRAAARRPSPRRDRSSAPHGGEVLRLAGELRADLANPLPRHPETVADFRQRMLPPVAPTVIVDEDFRVAVARLGGEDLDQLLLDRQSRHPLDPRGELLNLPGEINRVGRVLRPRKDPPRRFPRGPRLDVQRGHCAGESRIVAAHGLGVGQVGQPRRRGGQLRRERRQAGARRPPDAAPAASGGDDSNALSKSTRHRGPNARIDMISPIV